MNAIKNLHKIKWTLVYIALIPTINTLFLYVKTIPLPDGGHFTPLSILVGLVLVFRDFSQREIGNMVFLPVIIGATLSYTLAGPEIAVASGLAFLISEVVDWAVYSYTKRPFSDRVMISSVIAAPIDTLVFMVGASLVIENFMHMSTLVVMIASKIGGAFVISRILKAREKKQAAARAEAPQSPDHAATPTAGEPR